MFEGPMIRQPASGRKRNSGLYAALFTALWCFPLSVLAQDRPAGAGPAAGPAQTPGASAGVLAGRSAVTAILLKEPPTIDGRLDDAAWRSAARIGQFVQTRPLDGVPATEQTVVYVAYDSQGLYFGIHAQYSNPSLVRANRVDRDR